MRAASSLGAVSTLIPQCRGSLRFASIRRRVPRLVDVNLFSSAAPDRLPSESW